MPYPAATKYLESFINYEKIPAWPYKESLKLERIKEFLGLIGNPQDYLKCIHIAGTKGKGSTCAFIAYILEKAGYKVGLYTSPHLSDFRERIRIFTPKPPALPAGSRLFGDFEGMISKSELSDLVDKLKPAVEEYNKNSRYGPLSFFEVYTSLAFVYFKDNKVDFVVLETGLGGRLDATNVINSLVCAITSLSYEHTQKLGNTLREIAAEKAGIIKRHQDAGTPGHRPIVISAPQEPEAMAVIQERCRGTGAKLYKVGKDITYHQDTWTPRYKVNNSFMVTGVFGRYNNLKIKLIGEHQLVNATVAVGVIEALRAHNIKVGVDEIRKGLYNTVWPGRCEIVSRRPYIVLDGAQNIASARVLKKTIKSNFRYNKLILILGVSKDKDIKGICSELYGLSDIVILTKANNLRATEPQVLAGSFKNKESYITNGVRQARNKSIKLVKKEDLILVCGSLFVVGEFRDNFKQKRRRHG
ncbi:MAG: folylpolyglutamate synthase/dihydrofolate synthase family protein [Candidatus Omnitrophota bacterium]